MLIPDINGLVFAFRPDAPGHERYRRWLGSLYGGAEPVGIPDIVAWGVVRVSGLSIWNEPSDTAEALTFVRELRERGPGFRLLPGDRHLELVEQLCLLPGIRGNHVSDAILAAFALENDATLLTEDRGFARFPGVRARSPL